jgi:hypothetical protein
MLKYVYTVMQLCRMHMSKCLINYRSSILTPTRQSSNPWGLQIDFLTLFISPLRLAVINTAMGGHQPGSQKKQKRIQNSLAVSTLSTNSPRGRPPPPVTSESPTRHDNNNGKFLFSQTMGCWCYSIVPHFFGCTSLKTALFCTGTSWYRRSRRRT